jgi:hypothetical protein
MKKILIALGLAGLVGCSGLICLVFIAGRTVLKAEGQALYSAAGAWSRIQEYARTEGKTNYVSEANSKMEFLESQIASWRSRAEGTGINIADFEKMRRTAYETTDRNIKNGQNPLAYLDKP